MTEQAGTRGGLVARVSGCASGCAGAVLLVVAGVASVAGSAYELVQPRHTAQAQAPDVRCSLTWWRSLWGGARYRVSCDAQQDREISKLKLLSGPKGVTLVESVEDWGVRPWEDQRPKSGETIELESGRTWTYDGTISLGTLPWGGPKGTVTLSLEVDPGDVPLVITVPE